MEHWTLEPIVCMYIVNVSDLCNLPFKKGGDVVSFG